MYYLRMGVGIVMCFIGGVQLAAVLNEDEDGSSGSLFSFESSEWGSRCDGVARRAFGSAPHSHVDIDRGMLRLREQGCNPNAAPTGAIPMVTEGGPVAGDRLSNDWGGKDSRASRAMGGWGE